MEKCRKQRRKFNEKQLEDEKAPTPEIDKDAGIKAPLPQRPLEKQKSGVSESVEESLNHGSEESATSQSGTCKVLECMLRVEVKFPHQKVVNLIGEYEDYLESTGLLDVKDVKRRNNLQQKSNEDEDVKSVEEGDEKAVDFKVDPKDLHTIPMGTKNLGYYDVLKGMITRMELEGTLGKRREYGRTTKGGKINEERDEEYYYNLDDEFIDDNDLVNNESMHKDFSQNEIQNDEDLDKFYNNFEFLPTNTIEKFSENIKARKRKRMEDEKISDPKINEKMAQLEKAVNENKDGTINFVLQEVALKLQEDKENTDSDWLKYKDEIYLKLQRIFKEADRSKIEYILDLFCQKQDAKDEMNRLSYMLYRYIERNTKQYAHLASPPAEEPSIDEDGAPAEVNHEFVDRCIDKQAKDIMSTIREYIQKYLKCMNMYKVYKIHTGVKRMKSEDEIQKKLTGDLETDAEIYMKQHKETTLKGIFLKEKITSNTVIKKIKDIVLLFNEKHHQKILDEFEDILGYKIDVL